MIYFSFRQFPELRSVPDLEKRRIWFRLLSRQETQKALPAAWICVFVVPLEILGILVGMKIGDDNGAALGAGLGCMLRRIVDGASENQSDRSATDLQHVSGNVCSAL